MGAFGQRAGLVEQHDVHEPRPLEGQPVLDEDPGPGGDRGRQGDHERDGEAEGVGAGDHQHGDGAHDGLVDVAGQRPEQEGDGGGGGGDVEEQGGEAVGERLSSAPAGLGVGDEPLDPGEGGVLADGIDPESQRRVGRDGAADDSVSRGLGDRLGLARDHRLVHLCSAVGDRAVGRHPATGAHEHDITAGQLAEPDGAEGIAIDDLGLVGQQLGEGCERAAGLPDGLHLLPVSEQHDRHQRGQLPPELQVEPADARRQRRPVGDRDRHRDQEHHPGLTVTDLGDATGEERPTTPPEHERADHRTDPGDPWEVDRVAEPVHDHVAGDDQRDRRQQRQPEPATEHLRVVANVLVVIAVSMAVGGRDRGRVGCWVRVAWDVVVGGAVVAMAGHVEVV